MDRAISVFFLFLPQEKIRAVAGVLFVFIMEIGGILLYQFMPSIFFSKAIN
jgi:hypothetical protein